MLHNSIPQPKAKAPEDDGFFYRIARVLLEKAKENKQRKEKQRIISR